ncbi:Golgi reassembly-stacking protein 2 [Podochytrium sp. JEL0797]|nr:Golgi reassembly-stacking protein 2 [Podochytrium sp. JEL0797]
MGAATSSHDHAHFDSTSGQHGFHVLAVAPGSAAAQSGVEAFFDHIALADSGSASAAPHETQLAVAVGRAATSGEPLRLSVWSAKTRRSRVISLNVPTDGSPLGLTAALCARDAAHDKVWRILDVLQNSPAEHAGLRPVTDYIVGLAPSDDTTPPQALTHRDSLFELVQSRIGSTVSLVVYSSVMDSLRYVDLVPRYDWGGPGCMGCDIGFGPLHRIPNPESDNVPSHESSSHNHSHDDHHQQHDQHTVSNHSHNTPTDGPKPVMRIISKLGTASSSALNTHTSHGHSHDGNGHEAHGSHSDSHSNEHAGHDAHTNEHAGHHDSHANEHAGHHDSHAGQHHASHSDSHENTHESHPANHDAPSNGATHSCEGGHDHGDAPFAARHEAPSNGHDHSHGEDSVHAIENGHATPPPTQEVVSNGHHDHAKEHVNGDDSHHGKSHEAHDASNLHSNHHGMNGVDTEPSHGQHAHSEHSHGGGGHAH